VDNTFVVTVSHFNPTIKKRDKTLLSRTKGNYREQMQLSRMKATIENEGNYQE